MNNNNIWYLVGDENDMLKTYSFSKIEQLCKNEESYTSNPDFKAIINNPNTQWFSQNSIKVRLEIDSRVSEYFLRRELLPHQIILKQTPEKLVVQTEVAYDDEILKIVRYWIPHIKIIEPLYLDELLRNELNLYLNS